MAGARQPTNLLIVKGKKHLTKDEIENRLAAEVQPCTEDIAPPAYLTASQKKQFEKLAGQLQKIRIMGETDVDALARYITAQSLYEQAVKDLRAVQRDRPKKGSATDMAEWAGLLIGMDKRQDRYFKQAHSAASALGLTISSRCKLVVPTAGEPEKRNKFSVFGGKVAGDDA